ncbi:MAG: DUF58 domain-containing protein [Tepidisphaera sp.]|nr:DUF58 domain-containing protein [Tepidisphaera sp.]
MPVEASAQLRRPDELARGDFDMVVRRLADDIAFGADNSLFMGGGLEYAASRPYQPGDSVRLLDWRLSARTGKPFIKEYEALKRTSVYVVVDTSASMAVSSTELSKHDLAVWIASGVGLIAQRRLSPVAVVGAGERATRVNPSLVRSDLWRTIEPLRRGDLGERTLLGERLRTLLSRLDRSSVLVVLSDLHDPDALAALRQAGHAHDCMVVHLMDPAETGRLGAGFFAGQESETGRAFLAHSGSAWAHDHVRRDLIRAGVDYLLLRTDERVIPVLRQFLRARGGLLRGRG